MTITSSGVCRGIHRITMFLLLLCLGLASELLVEAQKTPPIFKSDTETSAVNKEYIRRVERIYLDNVGQNNDEAKRARNRLISIAVEQVDTAFNDFRKKSRKRHDLLQFIFDFLEIGASSAVSIVNGDRARSVIAEGLTLFQGSRAAFNRDFKFLERQILFDKMVAKRSQKLTEIYGNLNKDVVQYSWEQARSELKAYLYAGTIDEALSSLSVDTGAEAKTSVDQLERTKRLAGIVGAPTKAQIDESTANFNEIRRIIELYVNADNQLAAEKNKTSPDKTKIDSLERTKKSVLDGLGTIYASIEADPKLSPFLANIPDKYGKDNPALRARLEATLQKLKVNPAAASIEDYDLILPKLNGVIVDAIPEDSTLVGRLKLILSASKL